MITNTELRKIFDVSDIFATYWRDRASTLRPGQKALRSEKGKAGSKYGRSQVWRYSLRDAEAIMAGEEGSGPDVGNSRRRRSQQDREDDDVKRIRQLLRADGPMPLETFQSRMDKEHDIGWERASDLKVIERNGKEEQVFCTWPVGQREYYAGLPSQKAKLPNNYVDQGDAAITAELFKLLDSKGPQPLADIETAIARKCKCSTATIDRIREAQSDQLEEKRIGPLTKEEEARRAAWKLFVGRKGQEFPLSASDKRLKEVGGTVEAIVRECGEQTTAELKAEYESRTGKDLDSDTLSLCHRRGFASISVRKSEGRFPREFAWSYVEPPKAEEANGRDAASKNGPYRIRIDGDAVIEVAGRAIQTALKAETDDADREPTQKKKVEQEDADMKLWLDYSDGLSAGRWKSKAAFGRQAGIERSTVSKALDRGEAIYKARSEKAASKVRNRA